MNSAMSEAIGNIVDAIRNINDTIDMLDRRISRVEKSLAKKEGKDHAVQDQETGRPETLEDHKV